MSKKRIAAGIFCILMVFGGIGVMVEQPGVNLGGHLGLSIAFAALALWCFAPVWKGKTGKSSKPRVSTPLFMSQEAKLLCEHLFTHGPEAAMAALKTHGETHSLSAEELHRRLVAALPFAVDKALEDGVLSEVEENAMTALFDLANLSVDDLGRNREVLVKAALIRDLLFGTVRPRAVVDELPFNLNKNETLIWGFPGVEAGEYITKVTYEGGSQGVSLRVAKGVYWRTGAYRGERVERQHMQALGTGPLVVTNRHLYFKAGTDALRVAHKNVISVTPLDGAVLVHRSGARNKPLVFVCADPWFLGNLLTNAANWA